MYYYWYIWYKIVYNCVCVCGLIYISIKSITTVCVFVDPGSTVGIDWLELDTYGMHSLT